MRGCVSISFSPNVVRIRSSSSQTLQFDITVFEPFLPTVVTELMRLLSETDTFETKARILNALNTVITRAGARVRSFIYVKDSC